MQDRLDCSELEAKSLTTEATLQATTAPIIDLNSKPIFGYHGLIEVLLMGVVTVVGFKVLYFKSRLYLDRIHPAKPNLFRKLAQANCERCRFYNRDSHQQCSVHPVIVKLAQAEYCPDYWQRDKLKFFNR